MERIRYYFKRLRCEFTGHYWSKVHGYYDFPEFGAYCKKCGMKTETYQEWMKRTGQF